MLIYSGFRLISFYNPDRPGEAQDITIHHPDSRYGRKEEKLKSGKDWESYAEIARRLSTL